ncbi:MAG: glycosyltransferase, partial [Nitrosopumilaceae archaeon]|nr:glycosyltransferase [Nitrosopumilaceae archaeon]
QKNLGILASKPREVINGIAEIRKNYNEFEEHIEEFAKNFIPNGADNSAKIVAEILEEKR